MDGRLEKIFRGFGGDSAVYNMGGVKRITVSVEWALLDRFATRVFDQDGKTVLGTFTDPEYIQPHVAMARLGYTVQGTVDFAKGIADFEEIFGPRNLEDPDGSVQKKED